MEETNYYRKPSSIDDFGAGTATAGTPTSAQDEKLTDRFAAKDAPSEQYRFKNTDEYESSGETCKKTYAQKLKVFEKKTLRYPNRMKGMVLRPLIFLSFPVISYAGFCYGSNLVWFNVLNGTASLVLSKPPYGFSSSMVGLSYLSPLIGVFLA